jgi:hypothetical protein
VAGRAGSGILRLVHDGDVVGLFSDQDLALRVVALIDTLEAIPVVPLPAWPAFFRGTRFTGSIATVMIDAVGPASGDAVTSSGRRSAAEHVAGLMRRLL